MTALYAILLGIIQGVTEFLPVSSTGHLLILERMLGFSESAGLLFETFLHVGTLAAIFSVFRKDISKVFFELFSLALDLLGNFRRYLHNRHSNEQIPYTKLVTGSTRKLTVLLVLSFIPTFLIGFTARNLVTLSRSSDSMAPIGLLMTGIVLLVVDLGSEKAGKKGLAEATYDQAMWLGICQGIAAFPGISRLGLTLALSQFFGYKPKYAVRYSYLIAFPAILGAWFAQFPYFASPDMTGGLAASCILGMLASGLTAFFVIRIFLKLLTAVRLRYFAFYCFVVGVAALISIYL